MTIIQHYLHMVQTGKALVSLNVHSKYKLQSKIHPWLFSLLSRMGSKLWVTNVHSLMNNTLLMAKHNTSKNQGLYTPWLMAKNQHQRHTRQITKYSTTQCKELQAGCQIDQPFHQCILNHSFHPKSFMVTLMTELNQGYHYNVNKFYIPILQRRKDTGNFEVTNFSKLCHKTVCLIS